MSVSGYQISLATRETLAEVLRFNAVQSEAPPWSGEAWLALVPAAKDVRGTKVLLLLRDAEARLCGWLAGWRAGEIAELEFLLIDAALRRQGLARRLLLHWMGMAAEQGAGEMLLEVRASNRAAQALYQAMGFGEQGRRPAYYRQPPEDAILMRCALTIGQQGASAAGGKEHA